MKILVFSDSHASRQFMRRCMDTILPDAVVHLGDHYDDAETLAESYGHIPFHMVPGNCDRYRCPPFAREILCYDVCGIRLFMTHGHNHHVKSGIGALLADARKYEPKAVLYGHTHVAYCQQEPDGIWVLNPGSSGYGGRSAGLIEVKDHEIVDCKLITEQSLEEML